jgi:uncharacterized membrane protein
VNPSAKWLPIALAISLAFNVFFFGFYAVRMARRSHDKWGSSFEMGSERGELREKWRMQADGLRGRRQAVETARRAVRVALVAQPFDGQTLAAALTALRGETNDAQTALDQAFVRFAEGLTPEDRRQLAESHWFANLGRHQNGRSGAGN